MNNEQRIRYVYDSIVQYKLDHDGNSPTRDELAGLVQINKTTLHVILRILEARKLLRRECNRNKAGKIHVVGGVWLPPEGWESPEDAALRIARQQQEEAARLVRLQQEEAARLVRLQQEEDARLARQKQEEAARLAAKRAGLFCECDRDIIRWQKQVSHPNPHTILMCQVCRDYEVETHGSSGIEPYPPEEGGNPCPANVESAAVAVKAKSPTLPAKQPRQPSTPSATNGRRA